jgi:hypothetical protein
MTPATRAGGDIPFTACDIAAMTYPKGKEKGPVQGGWTGPFRPRTALLPRIGGDDPRGLQGAEAGGHLEGGVQKLDRIQAGRALGQEVVQRAGDEVVGSCAGTP